MWNVNNVFFKAIDTEQKDFFLCPVCRNKVTNNQGYTYSLSTGSSSISSLYQQGITTHIYFLYNSTPWEWDDKGTSKNTTLLNTYKGILIQRQDKASKRNPS